MKRFLPFLLIPFVLAPVSAFAHLGGSFFQKDVGAYTADIGYSIPAPAVGDAVAFDFQLRHAGEPQTAVGSDADFDDVWVKISSDKDVILATGLYNAPFGGPRLSYAFFEPGTYTISARYETKDNTLAETSFPLTVVPAGNQGNIPFFDTGIIFGIVGLLVGAGAAFALLRFLKKP